MSATPREETKERVGGREIEEKRERRRCRRREREREKEKDGDRGTILVVEKHPSR